MSLGNDPFIGAKLGSYEILEAIGEGGMARIYKGFHAELNRYTAIKVVNWGLQEDPEFTERFRREAQAIAILRHPNIVQIFDFGKHSSGYFMVMEFIDGSDLQVQLREYRDRQELLPKDKVVRVIRDVAAALDYAHSRGVIHRDVKPSNIMITREGQPILTDFGLVMLPTHKSQATIGNTFGTPHYVAPEQAISSAAAVAASDIYSLGVILYEMTTGQLPFDDDSPLSVALKHISDPPPAPTSINPNLSADVEDVLLQALSKDPTDRFATAGDMASALEMSWSSKGAAGRDRRAPTMLPAGVPPAAVVPSITLPTAAAVAPVTIAEPSAPEQTRSRSRALPLLPGWWPLAVGGVVVVLIGSWGFFSFFDASSAQPAPTPTTAAVIFATKEVVADSFPSIVPTDTPTPEPPTAIPTVLPTATSSPTNLPSPTATPLPTATLTSTPTSTLEPTATSTPLPTATQVPLPTVTPTIAPNALLSTDQLKGKILFKTDRAGFVQIYRMDADGSNQYPFDNASLYAQLEAELPFSSNKQEKMVVRGEGQLDLWRANLITNQELRVTSTGKPEYDAAWSPVDNRITYVSEETGNGDIYLLNLDGSAIERLTLNTDNFDKHPTWSPDGTKIAFWSDMGYTKTRQIWVIDLPTRVVRSLSDNPYNDWDPVWVR
ncbi:MAG: protein kinase [Anaerolineales bacterium]|nr:protein kinase [Anaerolineales bacterium]